MSRLDPRDTQHPPGHCSLKMQKTTHVTLGLACGRIPLELWREVWIMLWEDANNGYYYRDDQVQRMITLSSATFHIPQLWRHARVNVSSSKIAHGPISSWLSRAGSLPKSLTLVFSALKDSPSDCDLADNPTGRIAKACPGKESCVTSMLHEPGFPSRNRQCAMGGLTVPGFYIHRWGIMDPRRGRSTLLVLQFYPPIRHLPVLILPNVHESYLIDVDLPSPLLGNLTPLDLVWNGDFGWVIDLLSSCDKLEDLTIKFMTNVLTEQFDQDDITSWSDDLSSTSKWGGLSRLQKIRFVEFPGHLLECLQHLTFLNLREVSIQLGMDVGWMTQFDTLDDPELYDAEKQAYHTVFDTKRSTAFLNLLRGEPGSEPTIRSLTIGNGDFASHGDTLLPILQGLTSLETLTLDRQACWSPPYLPRLKFFEFRNLSVDVDEFEGLEEFTELRDVELFYAATLWDVK
ncbi:hypothetical protein FA13DRAFT_1723605 [Coprinellus micaceus]|uniref:Uncharacterized protein n=1 Tax=Coprinellus micaceus TaxID=71717 RepID=A0A4Y7TZ17_COPMI|nr:hypothetical protein FA13DRAFT_1723605 [Coprinellus micaceus]